MLECMRAEVMTKGFMPAAIGKFKSDSLTDGELTKSSKQVETVEAW